MHQVDAVLTESIVEVVVRVGSVGSGIDGPQCHEVMSLSLPTRL